MPAITCLLPVHNAAPYLAAAVTSILAQTAPDFELLILDDGSTDDSAAVAARFAGDPRVRILPNPRNMGLAATLNRGIACSDSRYIARMDADDVALPRRLQRQMAYLMAHPAIGLCGARRIDVYPPRNTTRKGRIHVDPDYIKAALFWDTVISHPTFFLCRARLVASGQLYDPALRAAEDYDLLCRLRPFMTFGNVATPLLRYTVRGDSLSRAAGSPADTIIANIRARNLDTLMQGGIRPGDHALNHRLRHAEPMADAVELADFLARLMAANTTQRCYPQHAFAQVLSEKLLRLIKRQEAHHLVPVFREFCRRQGVAVSPLLRARLGWVLATGRGQVPKIN